MSDAHYIIGINEVKDIKLFLESLLCFYAPLDVIFTTWGKLPPEVHSNLSAYKAHTSWLRRLFFHQADWHLNKESVNSIGFSSSSRTGVSVPIVFLIRFIFPSRR